MFAFFLIRVYRSVNKFAYDTDHFQKVTVIIVSQDGNKNC